MLTIVNISDDAKWDSIVRSFKDFDIYYLSGYVKGFQIHGDGEPVLFYFTQGDARAMNVFMLRNIADFKAFQGKIDENAYFDLTTPYGYGGFLLEGDMTEEFLKSLNCHYTQYMKKYNVISEFVRFHPLKKHSEKLKNMYQIHYLGKTIAIDLTTPEEVFANFSGKNRNRIRKAYNSGVEVFWTQDYKYYQKFIEIYNKTMTVDNAKDYYYFEAPFYESIIKELKYNSILFCARYNGEIIAMAIFLLANQQMNYHLSGSLIEYQYLAPTNLILHEASLFGIENGYKTIHLGGGLGCREDGIYSFKKGFNKNEDLEFYLGKKIFDQEKYQYLMELRKSEDGFECPEDFFPEYRYQH